MYDDYASVELLQKHCFQHNSLLSLNSISTMSISQHFTGIFAAALRVVIFDTFHDSLTHFTIKEVSRKLCH